MANEHVERFLGGLNTLGTAAGAVAQARAPKVDANAVTEKYRRLMEQGMPMREASIRARMELSGNPGLGPTPQMGGGQGPLPPQSAPANPQTFAQGLMRPSSSADYGGPEPEYQEVGGLMPQPKQEPISFNTQELDTIKALGLPEEHRARIMAEGAKERANISADTKKTTTEMTETGKGNRLGAAEAGRDSRTEKQIAAENQRAVLRAKTDLLKMDQAMARLGKQLGAAETRIRMRGNTGDPARKELVTRIGQQLRAVAQLKANWDQDPQTQGMVSELWDDIKVLQDELKQVEAEDKEAPPIAPQQPRPQMSVGVPQIQRAGARVPNTQSPGIGQASDADLENMLNEVEQRILGGR